jgi:hypothetical protein
VKYQHYTDIDPPRRRSWMVAMPLAVVIVLALLWTGYWFYASTKTQRTIEAWRAREASLGDVYACGSLEIGGYPFRIEVRCRQPSAELRSNQSPLAVKAEDLIVVSQVYDPTHLIVEMTGPLTASPLTASPVGSPPAWVANWALAQASIRGLPSSPQRVSSVFDKLEVRRGTNVVIAADHLELHDRIVSGSPEQNPLIEVVLRLGAVSAPALHPLAVQPVSGEISGVISGLKAFSPQPWAAQLRDLQASGGHIEITQARLQQADSTAVGDGALTLTPRGRLDGQLRLTIVGLDRLLSVIDLDRVAGQLVPQSELDKVAPGLDANKLTQSLDRIMPGLGGVVRKNSGTIAAAGVGALGQRTLLDGKPAVTLAMRFSDGEAFLGPIPLGQTPPLF